MKNLNHRRAKDIMKQEKKTISPETAAALYDLSPGTLANMRSRGIGPKFYKVGSGRKVLYKVDDFEAWLTSSPVMTKDSINLKLG
jgi:hypothetical protein